MDNIKNIPCELFGLDTEKKIPDNSEVLKVKKENPNYPFKEVNCPFKEEFQKVFEGGLGIYCDKIRTDA